MSWRAAVPAASWLCRSGRAEGVKALLDQGEGYTALNALRKPVAWKRLESKTIEGDLEGTRIELADRLAREAGMRIEWRREDGSVDVSWALERARLRSDRGRMSVAGALEQLVRLSKSEFDAILEDDVIRIVPESEAGTFWEKWSEEQPKKK